MSNKTEQETARRTGIQHRPHDMNKTDTSKARALWKMFQLRECSKLRDQVMRSARGMGKNVLPGLSGIHFGSIIHDEIQCQLSIPDEDNNWHQYTETNDDEDWDRPASPQEVADALFKDLAGKLDVPVISTEECKPHWWMSRESDPVSDIKEALKDYKGKPLTPSKQPWTVSVDFGGLEMASLGALQVNADKIAAACGIPKGDKKPRPGELSPGHSKVYFQHAWREVRNTVLPYRSRGGEWPKVTCLVNGDLWELKLQDSESGNSLLEACKNLTARGKDAFLKATKTTPGDHGDIKEIGTDSYLNLEGNWYLIEESIQHADVRHSGEGHVRGTYFMLHPSTKKFRGKYRRVWIADDSKEIKYAALSDTSMPKAWGSEIEKPQNGDRALGGATRHGRVYWQGEWKDIHSYSESHGYLRIDLIARALAANIQICLPLGSGDYARFMGLPTPEELRSEELREYNNSIHPRV